MPFQLDSATGFASALAEVELLLAESDNAGPASANPNEQRVATMNKVALLLLMGKFEAFIETAIEDFVGGINGLKVRRRHVPQRVLLEHSVRAVKDLEIKLNGSDVANVEAIFCALAKIWSDEEPCVDLKLSATFNYGKHGSEEVEKLCKRVGLGDIFTRIVINDPTELYEGATPVQVNVSRIVNSLTNIRNNILHEDATPSLTTADLRKYSQILKEFIDKLVVILQDIVNRAEQAALAEAAHYAH